MKTATPIPEALIFDVFGTLVDWREGVAAVLAPVFAAKGIAADPRRFADLWRAEYDPAMAPVRDGLRAYRPLDVLHRENLGIVLDREGLTAHFGAAEVAELARAWERLPPWPGTVPGLARLRTRFLVAPCSNGSIALMARLARFAGLGWDAILGADIARNYKPHPSVYLASCAAFGLAPDRVMMVACHPSDLAAARAAGLRTGFIPRPAEFGPGGSSDPKGDWDVVAGDLGDLARQLGA